MHVRYTVHLNEFYAMERSVLPRCVEELSIDQDVSNDIEGKEQDRVGVRSCFLVTVVR